VHNCRTQHSSELGSDSVPSYPPDNHRSSDDVWEGRGFRILYCHLTEAYTVSTVVVLYRGRCLVCGERRAARSSRCLSPAAGRRRRRPRRTRRPPASRSPSSPTSSLRRHEQIGLRTATIRRRTCTLVAFSATSPGQIRSVDSRTQYGAAGRAIPVFVGRGRCITRHGC